MLRRRSIRLRIIVLVLVPVVALVGLYSIVLNLTLGNLLTLKQEAAIRQLVALPVAHVQTQLARERLLALQYVASPRHAGLSALLVQEHRTDLAIKSYQAAVDTALKGKPVPKERQAFLAWETSLGKISVLRTSVVSLKIHTGDLATDYSAVLVQGDDVLNQAIIPVLTGPLGIQATDLLTMARSSQNLGEESDLLRADLIAHSFPATDVSIIDQKLVLHQEQWNDTMVDLSPSLQGYFQDLLVTKAAGQVQQMEAGIVGMSGPSNVPLRAWNPAVTTYQAGFLSALLKSAATLARQATKQAQGLITNLILIAGLGLLAIVVAIGIAILLGRGLVRQLSDLRQSAVDLSSERLPAAIMRLRAGEDIDLASEVPELEPSNDEIGQVRQAFNTAARTAIAAAVDEVRIRQGVNDVFRNLARRNQSLLTRQLQLLDGMERRVHDPEELADLFRIDHLTTRMRRHAEGLLIVAGGTSGRVWREPVPVVDVMRAAVAEVEDYTRIRVTSRSGASVAGHAVADIIHMLAELVENATSFSPANTPVRIDGDVVARGVVVEIEDRGLGMSEMQITELNATLADPPLFDLSGSDQLGLFIAGQLARRHDIKITLRGSPYGGVTAVVLIPTALIVNADGFDEPASIASVRELGGRPVALLPGIAAEPDRTILTATAVAEPEADLAPALQADLQAGGASSDADRITGQPMPRPFGRETSPWPAVTGFDPPGFEPSLPTRQPGSTGLTWSENGISAVGAAVGADVTDPDLLSTGPDEIDGLPMRVRQASLAPQLRHEDVVVQPENFVLAPEPSPEAARSTMAALQHGWERGRSVSEPIADEFRTSPSRQRSGDSPDEDAGGSR